MMRLKGGLECKLMSMFCVGIVHTNCTTVLFVMISGQNAIFRTILYCILRMWLTPGMASGSKN